MRVIAAVAFACVLAASTASAHHSLALFETGVPVTFQGKVTRVDWRSPHTIIFVEAVGPGGPTEWRVETVPNSWLINRAGWTIESVKPGDQVTVELYAYSDPTIKYGFLRRIIKADGKVWNSPLDIGRRGQAAQ
jgi:Family of unknown function (DUF6152)